MMRLYVAAAGVRVLIAVPNDLDAPPRPALPRPALPRIAGL